MRALESLDRSKVRTLGITTVSAASLWFKAREYKRAQAVAGQGLAATSMPAFAIDQLQSLLQTIWNEEARAKSGLQFIEGEVLVSVSGGEVVTGGAPVDGKDSSIGGIVPSRCSTAAKAQGADMNIYQPVQRSQWTAGRWQIGDGPDAHELTSGDVIEFCTNVYSRLGRVEHNEHGYIVIPDDGEPAVLMVDVREARYLGSGRL